MAMAALGFCAVFIIDVGLSLVGSVQVGSLTASELVDKISDRVFDEDVPEPKKKPAAKKTAAPPKPSRQARESTPTTPATAEPETPRAPLPAPRPEAYQAEAKVEADPEVERARARLDQLLKGL